MEQEQDDRNLHPVAYANRTISIQDRYGITDLEALALVWACRHFRAYLLGHHCTVVTDHAPPLISKGDPTTEEDIREIVRLQLADPLLAQMHNYLSNGVLPKDTQQARKLTLQKDQFTIQDGWSSLLC